MYTTPELITLLRNLDSGELFIEHNLRQVTATNKKGAHFSVQLVDPGQTLDAYAQAINGYLKMERSINKVLECAEV